MAFNKYNNPPPIPAGYRELEVEEMMEKGDEYFNFDSTNKWEKRDGYDRPYRPFHKKCENANHYITIRKLKTKTKEEINQLLYKINILASSQENYKEIIEFLETQGFNRNWTLTDSDFENGYRCIYVMWGEIGTSKNTRLDNKEVYSFQKLLIELNLNKKIELTEENKNSIINKIKESKAFNEDSALEMKEEYLICNILATQGLIKEYDRRFYV